MVDVCHQRKIRNEASKEEPRSVPQTLEGFTVVEVTKAVAEPIILKYEWLGTLNSAPVAFYGLKSPDGGIHGVACFGIGNGTNSGKITTTESSKPITLERGACVHWAHPHAPSMLVAGACRAMYRDYGFNTFFAYSDWDAGEIGTIYQACNWIYLGQAPGRPSNYRWKYENRKTGKVLSSRAMRALHKREGRGLLTQYDQTEWNRIKDMAKAKYVWFEGSKRQKKKLRAGLRHEPMPYPKRA